MVSYAISSYKTVNNRPLIDLVVQRVPDLRPWLTGPTLNPGRRCTINMYTENQYRWSVLKLVPVTDMLLIHTVI